MSTALFHYEIAAAAILLALAAAAWLLYRKAARAKRARDPRAHAGPGAGDEEWLGAEAFTSPQPPICASQKLRPKPGRFFLD